MAVAIDQESGFGFIGAAPARKKKECDPAVDEACGLLRAAKHKLENNDGFYIFGGFVANKVRDLNSYRLQAIIQHRIHTILLEAEMEFITFHFTKNRLYYPFILIPNPPLYLIP